MWVFVVLLCVGDVGVVVYECGDVFVYLLMCVIGVV